MKRSANERFVAAVQAGDVDAALRAGDLRVSGRAVDRFFRRPCVDDFAGAVLAGRAQLVVARGRDDGAPLMAVPAVLSQGKVGARSWGRRDGRGFVSHAVRSSAW